MSIKVRAIKDGYRNNRIIKPGMGEDSEFVIESFSEFSRGFKEPSKVGKGRKQSGWMEIVGISKDHKEKIPEQRRMLAEHMKAVKEARPVEEEFTNVDEFQSVDDMKDESKHDIIDRDEVDSDDVTAESDDETEEEI